MAIAAYASLVYLTNVLDNIRHPVRLRRLHLDIKQIESLQENVDFLLEFLQVHSQGETDEMRGLVKQIAVVAYEAEDIIDLHVTNQLHRESSVGIPSDLVPGISPLKRWIQIRLGSCVSGCTSQNSQYVRGDVCFSSFRQDMDKVIQNFVVFRKELSMAKEVQEDVRVRRQPRVSVPAASLATSSGGRNVTVGLDEHVVSVMDELTRDKSNLQIVPIIGMGGIGKTTLAKNVFGHPYIVNHFYIREWVDISLEYNIHGILLGLLSEEEIKGTGENLDLDGMGEILHKKLFGQRYLIVMDDVWTPDAWNALKMFFPNNCNGSRIMITTRLSNVAVSLGCQNPFWMTFLDEEKSWNLLCQKVFARESCPYPKLVEIGKDIAKSCKGLPLAIVVIGSMLANSNMTRKYWKFVAENVKSLCNLGDNEHCLKILSLSYDNLPIHLKPCFLYIRNVLDGDQIKVSKLIKLWVAEGFIKPVRDRSLKEIAKEYLKDLIDRSIIFIRSWTSRGEIKTCGIHDLLRDLCLRESNKEHFIRIAKAQFLRPNYGRMKPCCFMCGHSLTNKEICLPELVLISPSASRVSPVICDACKRMHSHIWTLRLVKVMQMFYNDFSEELVQHTKLLCISVELYEYGLKFPFPQSLHLLWNLQTLIIDNRYAKEIVLPSEIWEMLQLRNLEVQRAVLAYPVVTHIEEEDFRILKNLQTLLCIKNFMSTKEVLDRIPNLKKLKIYYEVSCDGTKIWPNYSLYNLAQLHNLESLYVRGARESMAFPSSLKKLILSRCRIPWKDMAIIGSLPNLEVLKLYNTLEGPEWNPVEGEFLQLKVLLIHSTELVRWRADQIHFPVLERLFLEELQSLEIPLGFGDIATLKSIDLYFCGKFVINSAIQIWEEQQSMGNESLQIHVRDAYGQRYIGASSH